MNSEPVLNYDSNMSVDHALTFQSSELSRSSAEVFDAASEQPVRVTRRNGETLVLMSESANSDRNTLLELAAQLIASSVRSTGSLASSLSDRFPWMLALSEDDRNRCAQDIVDAARASFSTQQSHLAVAEITSWRESATAIAAGLGECQVEWLGESEPVDRP